MSLEASVMETVACLECGRVFKDFAGNHRRFCSRVCYWRDLKKRKPPNYRKHYSMRVEARKHVSDGLKAAYKDGRRKPIKRKPYLLCSQQDGKLLKELYLEEKLSADKIALQLGVSDITVLRRLRFHGILIRPPKSPGFKKSEEKTETDLWLVTCPCFCCAVFCSENHLGLSSPLCCEKLDNWLQAPSINVHPRESLKIRAE